MRCHLSGSSAQVDAGSVGQQKLTVRSVTIVGALSQRMEEGLDAIGDLEGGLQATQEHQGLLPRQASAQPSHLAFRGRRNAML